jgi:Zn-dependent M16 (insulinase) family peptidase
MPLIHNFQLLRQVEIAELNTRARLFRHLGTGAELLSLENDDENKVFGLTLRTPPSDSTGLPHIMEHSVLCGSRKYPLKDPFAELYKSSLQTFLNAFTYPDKTVYPFASQNLKDFYNLLDVYIDAVFHPLIHPRTLQQQGWHYELERAEDPLIYKGVVFNEMKGAYSSPENIINRYSQQTLFPDTTYGLDSGGDPREIPDLTYAQFREFHQRYYHPSNARIYFYGDGDPDERLRRMDGYLSEFDALEIDSSINLQPALDQPQRVTIPYDASDDGRKPMATMNWLLGEVVDPVDTISLQILAHILVGTPASPLRKALIDSALGEDLVGVGLEDELRQLFFSTGLKGLNIEDVDQMEALIEGTLLELVSDGIEAEMVAAAINTIEFRRRENSAGAFPRGLLLMLRSLTSWLYGRDPIAPLAFAAPLAEIKENLSRQSDYFEGLIQNYFIGNPHRTTVILEPDAELRQQQEQAEAKRLAEARALMSEADLLELVESTRALKIRQDTPDPPEALAVMPRLSPSDLDKEIKRIPSEEFVVGETKTFHHDLFTNGIVYLDLGFDLHALPQEYIPYAKIFGRLLVELGTEVEDFVALSQRIGISTGGIRPTTFTSPVRGSEQSVAWLMLRGKAMLPQTDKLLGILQDILLTVRLDNPERFKQIVLESKAEQETSLVPRGHQVVNTRLRASFNEAGWIAEQIAGVEQLFFLRRLLEQIDEDWPTVLGHLQDVHRYLVNRKAMVCNITVDGDNWLEIRPRLDRFLNNLPLQVLQKQTWSPALVGQNEGLTIPAQVNYVGVGADLYQLGYELAGSVLAITKHLQMGWLWEQVRVKGGAYGVLCPFSLRSGVITFMSYRDPNLLATLDVFDRVGAYVSQHIMSEEELTRSIIGAIGEMDTYQLPDLKGYTSLQRHLVGDTDEYRQRLRDQLLSTTEADFHAFGQVLTNMKNVGRVVVLGSQQAIVDGNTEGQLSMEIRKIA